METYVVRVWLPDRPGALGAVASRIGAVRGDVVGIDILETGGGQAVDELVVRLPQGQLVDLLVSEIEQVDGVHVEFVRPAADAAARPPARRPGDGGRAGGADTTDELLRALCVHGGRTLGAEWVGGDRPRPAARSGPRPGPTPTEALARRLRRPAARAGGDDRPGASATPMTSPGRRCPAAGLALVAGRAGTPFRAKERRQVVGDGEDRRHPVS